jgi:hypothetical protein
MNYLNKKKRKLPNDSTEMGSKISVVEIDTTKNKIVKLRAQGSSSSSSTVSMTSTSQKQQQQPSTHSNLVNQISTIQTPTSTQQQQQSNYIISAETHSQKFLPLKLLVNKSAHNTTTSTTNFNHHQKQQHSTFDLIEMKNIFTPTSTSPTMPINTDSNSYYKSVDNISELDSIDYPSDQDEFNDDDEAMMADSGDECDRDVMAATVSLNRRKRSDSNCENFVLIIDNVAEQKQCQSNSVKPVETKRHNDVILSVLNISHGSNNEKGYL